MHSRPAYNRLPGVFNLSVEIGHASTNLHELVVKVTVTASPRVRRVSGTQGEGILAQVAPLTGKMLSERTKMYTFGKRCQNLLGLSDHRNHRKLMLFSFAKSEGINNFKADGQR